MSSETQPATRKNVFLVAVFRPQVANKTDAPQPDAPDEKQIQKNSTAVRAQQLLQTVSDSKLSLPLAWNAAFQNQELSSTVLQVAFVFLHQQQRYEDVVEGIQAAIRNDHAQPWMYDVLAIEMKLAGRPQKQIDRVLLSRLDFAPGDETQVLVTASTMAGFDAFPEALNLCREAAKRNPWQPAVWSTARSIADRYQDSDAIVWSRCGTIQYVWKGDYQTMHAEAEAVIQDLQARLMANGQTQQAEEASRQLAKAKQRDLRISILWSGDADLDLSVLEPNGAKCSRKTLLTTNGGMLIATSSGGKPTGRRGQHREEYVCVSAPAGEFQLQIKYISGRVTLGKVILQVVRYENTEHETSQTQSFDAVVDRDLNIKLQLDHGRQKK